MLKQATVWSKSVGKLDKNKDKEYIVNQVLMYGSLGEIADLKQSYGIDEIKRIFVEKPSQIYSKPAFNLIKNIILKINTDLDMGRYIKSVY